MLQSFYADPQFPDRILLIASRFQRSSDAQGDHLYTSFFDFCMQPKFVSFGNLRSDYVNLFVQ